MWCAENPGRGPVGLLTQMVGLSLSFYCIENTAQRFCSLFQLSDFNDRLMFYILSQPHAVEFYIILTQATVICKEGTEVEKIPLRDWPVGKPLAHFLN